MSHIQGKYDYSIEKSTSFSNIYQVTYIKYCIESIKRNVGLFAAAKYLAIFAQVEFQLKK